MENNHLIIGYDLGSRNSRISWCDEKADTVENAVFDGGRTQLPTALCRVAEDSWLCGYEAQEAAKEGRGTLLTNFVDDYESSPVISAGGERFEKKTLVCLFLRESLKSFSAAFEHSEITYMTVSLGHVNKAIMADITENAAMFGVDPKCLRVQSNIASYEYYALSQKKELWTHDVGLFEYDDDGLNYCHLSISKKHQPVVVQAQVYPLKMYMSAQMLDTGSPEDLDHSFAEVLNQVLAKKLISTIYLTGRGFAMTWLNDAKRRLCSGRKVFYEENVYAAGACYSGRLDQSGGQFKRFIALNDDIVPVNIYLKGTINRETVRRELVSAGSAWYNVGSSTSFVMDGTDTVVFRVRDLTSDAETLIPLKLEDLPERDNRTVIIRAEASFESASICDFTMTDMGFGSIYPPSGKVWKRRINVAEYESDKRFREQGRLVFLRELPERIPFYFYISRTKVYSLEELCYYIYNNIYAITAEDFSEELIYWIDKALQEGSLANDLRSLKRNNASVKTMVLRLMSYADYCSNEDYMRLSARMDEIEHQDPLETKKIQGDNLVRFGRYMEAISAYTAVIGQLGDDERMTDEFRGNVYHNLGAAWMRLMNFRSAAAAFRQAYLLNKNVESLKCYLWALKMGGDESAFFDAVGEFKLSDAFVGELVRAYDAAEAGISVNAITDDRKALAMLEQLREVYRGGD